MTRLEVEGEDSTAPGRGRGRQCGERRRRALRRGRGRAQRGTGRGGPRRARPGAAGRTRRVHAGRAWRWPDGPCCGRWSGVRSPPPATWRCAPTCCGAASSRPSSRPPPARRRWSSAATAGRRRCACSPATSRRASLPARARRWCRCRRRGSRVAPGRCCWWASSTPTTPRRSCPRRSGSRTSGRAGCGSSAPGAGPGPTTLPHDVPTTTSGRTTYATNRGPAGTWRRRHPDVDVDVRVVEDQAACALVSASQDAAEPADPPPQPRVPRRDAPGFYRPHRPALLPLPGPRGARHVAGPHLRPRFEAAGAPLT